LQYPRLLILAAVVIVVAALYLAQAVLVPVALAIFLSFVLSPLVARLERLRLGRVPAVMVVALLAFAAIGSIGWMVGRQAMDLATRLPEYRANLDARFATLRQASAAVRAIESSASGEAAAAEPSPALSTPHAPPAAPAARAAEPGWTDVSLSPLLSLLGTASIVVLLVFIMLVQRGDLRDRFIALMGGGVVVTTQALDEAGARLSRYLLALTLINASYGAVLGVALRLIGVPNGLLWGILAATLRFVPYVGPWVAAAFPILFAFAISDDLATPLLTCGLFVTLEVVTNLVVEPLVFSNRIGVSTTALVVGAVFWTWLWGAAGLLLATPLTVCVAVMGNHIPRMRFLSMILGDKSGLSASVRLYQRLHVGDAEDAWNLIAAERKEGRTVVEVYDSLLIPALCLAQQDRLDLVIDDAALVKVTERANELAEEIAERRDAADAAPLLVAPLRVVCVAAGKESDGAASAMLVSLLRHAGFDASEAPHGMLGGTAPEEIATTHVGAVCVSQVPPLSFARLRYVCKRIAQRFPGTPILVGTWTMSLDPAKVHERLESDGRLQVAGSLAEMVQQIERIAARARPSPTPDPPVQEVELTTAKA
jgi:predicted PurR-regulated permease PerM